MSQMLRTAARSVFASRGRFVLTGTAITLSVAFLVATLVLSESMRGRAAGDIAEALAGTDAVVQGVVLGEPGGGPGDPERSVRRSLDPDITERVAAVDGVDGAASQWVDFGKLVVDGSSVGTGTASDVGRNWVAVPALNPFRLTSGRPPIEVGEIVVDRSLAGDAGVAPGDVVQVLTATGMHDATITGIATFASADAAPLQRTVLLPDAAVSSWLDTAAPTEVLVDVAEGADRAEVLGRVSALTDAEVIDGPDHIRTMQDAATSPLQFLTVFLLAFAVVAVLIGVTIIFNTLALTVARRRRESGLLRAIGAHRRQLLGGVVIEAGLVGTIATLTGLVCASPATPAWASPWSRHLARGSTPGARRHAHRARHRTRPRMGPDHSDRRKRPAIHCRPLADPQHHRRRTRRGALSGLPRMAHLAATCPEGDRHHLTSGPARAGQVVPRPRTRQDPHGAVMTLEDELPGLFHELAEAHHTTQQRSTDRHETDRTRPSATVDGTPQFCHSRDCTRRWRWIVRDGTRVMRRRPKGPGQLAW
jgi:hypothetical protein